MLDRLLLNGKVNHASVSERRRSSGWGLGVSDEQADQVELIPPPDIADFKACKDAPTLHRLRQVSNLHVTDGTDPARIATNTGRSVAGRLMLRPIRPAVARGTPFASILLPHWHNNSVDSICLPALCRPINFEGCLFVGKAMLWTKGVPTEPRHLFQGQRRKSSITVQGRFKRPVVMNHFVAGPEFTRPFVNLPAQWFVEGVLLRVRLLPMSYVCRAHAMYDSMYL